MNNYMKTIISGLQSYIHSYTKKARSNWNQNNPDAIDYIKNRPFYSETKNTVLLNENIHIGDDDDDYTEFSTKLRLNLNQEYLVVINGVEYKCTSWSGWSEGTYIGNGNIYGGPGKGDSNCPFAIESYSNGHSYFNAIAGDYQVSIIGNEETIVKIPEKYLPVLNSNILNGTGEGAVKTKYASEALGDYSFAEGNETKANGEASHAEGNETKANGEASHAEGYYTIANGQYSHAEGSNTRAIGNYSHAEGYATKALGDNSHAEGNYTIANNYYSHAEGSSTIANGNYSHAEGEYRITTGHSSHAEGKGTYDTIKISGAPNSTTYELHNRPVSFDVGSVLTYNNTYSEENAVYSIVTNIDFDNNTIEVDKTLSSTETFSKKYIRFYQGANGDYSHAEGYATIANGEASHAEGYYTRADGQASHAEGYNTTASGIYSHAEGYNTQAIGNYSHAEGYNTRAIGNYSHAEGYATIANSNYQHVQGKYNIKDTENKYVHIIGNGDEGGMQANIHTIDWHGNAWFSGDVRIGGKNYESGKKIYKSVTEVVLEPSKWNDNKQTVLVEGISSNNLKQFIQIIPNENDQENLKIIKKCEIKAVEQVENGIVFNSSAIPISEVSFYVIWEDIDWIGAAPGLTGLIDFNYEENEDGTYTLTSWKGTFNGEPSTEIRIPNDPRVIF